MSTRPDGTDAFGGSVGPAWSEADGLGGDETPLADDRYEHGGELGRGGMGVVAVATDRWLDREVALKRARRDLPEATRERLVREARLTARLDHPSIVPILDFGVDGDGPFYTMPVINGATLAAAAADSERSLASLVKVLEAVARAVAYAHDRGIVHRDLKPENVLIGSFGEVRVLDWGVALDPSEPDAHAVGTRGYQAPEQSAGVVVGPPADVYALGRTLGFLLASREAPASLDAVVRRATDDDPSRRYSDAGEFADELERWLEGRRVEAHDYTPRELLQRFVAVWRGPLIAGTLGTIGLVAVLSGWATTNGWERDRALVAESESRTARERADANLAAALLQSAGAYLLADARPQAELLAARSLQLAESPEARGILMGAVGLPPFALASEGPVPCERAFPSSIGDGVLCIGDSEAWVVDGEHELWRVTLTDPESGGPVRTARLHGDLAMVIRDFNTFEVFRDGALVRSFPPMNRSFELLGRSGRGVRDTHRVGWVEDDGSIRWTAHLCETVPYAWTDGERFGALCGETLVTGDFAGARSERRIAHPPSAVGFTPASGWIVGTLDGYLLTEANGWVPEPASVGAVSLLENAGERVLVVGEDLTPRIWDPATGAFGDRLPGRSWVAVADDGRTVRVLGETLQRWRLPEPGHPMRLTRGGGDGLPFLAVEGETLLSGSSRGDVFVWDAPTGAHRLLAKGCGNVAKTGLFAGDLVSMTQLGCATPTWTLDRSTGERSDAFGRGYFRFMEEFRGARLGVSYGVGAFLQEPGGEVVAIEGAFATADAGEGPDGGESAWLLRRDGWAGELRDGAFAQVLSVPEASDLAVASGRIWVAEGDALVGYTPEGEVAVRWVGPRALTAVEASGRYVVAGDLDGRVHVLDAEANLLATARGHARRVSEVRIAGDTVWTASWDGSAHRWSLAALDVPVERIAEDAARWGLTVEDVLRLPTP
ncbi:MAG: protein kinase [Alphaproteobacteria bacterium]|nr:protein kinase [Alphaproteobacteria bacterium]